MRDTGYSVFRHLGRALWRNAPKNKRWFVVLTGHYDAASHENDSDEPLVVAGLMTTEEQWCEFERAWRRTLQLFGVTHHHMMDCAQWRGEFEAWGRDDTKRRAYLESLLQTMKRCIIHTVTFHIVPADYNEVNAEYEMGSYFWDGAYSMATMLCIRHVERWQEVHRPEACIGHIVERGDTGQGSITKWDARFGIAWPVTVLPKRNEHTGEWFHPFGACDFVAYESKVAASREMKGDERAPRGSYVGVLDALRPKVTRLNAATMRKWCIAFPEKHPRRDGKSVDSELQRHPEVLAMKERVRKLEEELAGYKKKMP